MTNSIYIASTSPRSGKSIVIFGMMDYLVGRSHRIGFFQPIAPSGGRRWTIQKLVSEHWEQAMQGRVVVAHTTEEAEAIVAEKGNEALHASILQAYKELEARCDFVVCTGTGFTSKTPGFEFEFNLDVARNLGTPLVPVVDGMRESGPHIVEQLKALHTQLARAKSQVVATVVCRVDPEALDEARQEVFDAFGNDCPVFVMPEEPALERPTLQDILEETGAKRVDIDESMLGKEVKDIKVAAMGLPNFLSYITDGGLVIAPGDRADILAGCLLAHRSTNYPDLAGIMLTGGLLPDERIARLMSGVEGVRLPMLSMEEDTYSTVRKVELAEGWLAPNNPRKLATAVELFQSSVDPVILSSQLDLLDSAPVTPLMFEQQLLTRAASHRKKIVLPEGEDERILRAAAVLLSRNVADIVLLGNVETVLRRASRMGVDISAAEIMDPLTSPLRERFVTQYESLRRHKGITRSMAEDQMSDVSYFGTMMVHLGEADGMVSGAVNTTARTLRPSLQFIKTRPEVSLVSSVFLMCLRDRVLVYGDCAVNPKPSASELADIAASSARTAAMFDIEPRVAMLSYSSGSSGQGEEVERVSEATALCRERNPSLAIEGPIQYDAAADMSVGQAKMPDSEVAGRATIFIFPDLNAGNNAYKAVQRSADAVAVGPILQGLNKPVNDLSRGCTVSDIVNTVAITAIQAQEQ